MRRHFYVLIIIATLLTNVLVFAIHIQSAKASTITVPDDYPTIQEAVNNANAGDTVFVRNGTYYEHIVVDKTLSLIGENVESTVLNGTDIDPTMIVEANDVKISGFTFEGWTFSNIVINTTNGVIITGNKIIFSSLGVDVENSINATIENNLIDGNGLDNIGVMLAYSSECRIANNTITNAIYDGIRLWFSNNNSLHQNLIMNNNYGIFFFESSQNTVTENTISKNSGPGIDLESSSSNNKFMHNNFIDNWTPGFYDSTVNTWDDGYPSGGNYWSDYNGTDFFGGEYQNDTVTDGIGDTPYFVDASNRDNYPLMFPFGSIPGDVDGDGSVGIDDIFLVASHFSNKLGEPGYFRIHDLNGDGYIGVDDIFITALHFGEEKP
jgi:parallel beta-helix repeat protein